jgi:hypothetical protein
MTRRLAVEMGAAGSRTQALLIRDASRPSALATHASNACAPMAQHLQGDKDGATNDPLALPAVPCGKNGCFLSAINIYEEQTL